MPQELASYLCQGYRSHVHEVHAFLIELNDGCHMPDCGHHFACQLWFMIVSTSSSTPGFRSFRRSGAISSDSAALCGLIYLTDIFRSSWLNGSSFFLMGEESPTTYGLIQLSESHSHRPRALPFNDCGILLSKTRELRPITYVDGLSVGECIPCVILLFVGYGYRQCQLSVYCLSYHSTMFALLISLCFFHQPTYLFTCGSRFTVQSFWLIHRFLAGDSASSSIPGSLRSSKVYPLGGWL